MIGFEGVSRQCPTGRSDPRELPAPDQAPQKIRFLGLSHRNYGGSLNVPLSDFIQVL